MSVGSGLAIHSNVLALNRLYLAIHVISVRRAFCLLWKGLAEVINVEDDTYIAYDFESWREICEFKQAFRRETGDAGDEHEDWIHAVNFRIQVPRVVRLLNYDRVPRNVVKFNRRNVFLRDENRCQYCSRKFGTHDLSLDHVLPRSRGGETNWENIVSACLRCNVRKGGRTPQEAGMRLFREPIQPKRSPVLVHQLSTQKYSCWQKFVR